MLKIIKSVLIKAKETTCSDLEQVEEQVVFQNIIDFCEIPRTRNEFKILWVLPEERHSYQNI